MIRFLSNRWVHFTILSALVIASAVYNFSNDRWRKEISYFIFDAYNRKHQRPATDLVIIVDIDDASLEKLGQWPWPRTIMATWVDNLTQMGAKAIVFDGVLAEPDRTSPKFLLDYLPTDPEHDYLRQTIQTMPDHDYILANSIRESGIFVSGFTYASQVLTPRRPRLARNILAKKQTRNLFLAQSYPFKNAAVFLPQLENVAAGNGSFMADPDMDGIIRRTPLIFSNKQTLYPSLSLEALRVAYGNKNLIKISQRKDAGNIDLDTDYRVLINDQISAPVNPDGIFNVYYRPFYYGRDYISAFQVIQGTVDPQRIKNKIVLIGSSAEGLKDLRSTAIQSFRPGVEIHANVIEQILQQKFLLRPDFLVFVEAVALLLCGVLIVLFAPFVHAGTLGFFSMSIAGALWFGGYYAFENFGLQFDVLYAAFSIFMVFMISTILSYLRTESERQQIRDAFGFYISPEYMQELTEHPDKLKLGGERRELTVMFSDIRSFTTISEGLDPEELIQLMNDFLTPMSDLVMQNKGTIDKYMGDAMMAFWNAPLDDKNHARNACLTALSMQKALEPINEEIKERAKEEGKDPVLLEAGIGVNTGPCAVGNMGSKQRFAYSTLGDAVNVAARLEGQTKYYGTNILIGEETWKSVSDLACVEADLVQVIGKTTAARIFILLGDQAMQSDPAFQEYSLKHASMIDLYRTGDFKRAKKLLKELQKEDKYDLSALFEVYETRIKTFIKTPPKNWRGVHVADSK